MNKYCKQSFDKIKGAASAYKREVTSALDRYRQTMEAAATEAQQYKDETGFLAGKKASAVTAARNSITVSENAFTSIVKAETAVLRDELSRHVASAPNDRFLATLRVYADFGLAPGKAEITALMDQAGGNGLALRALNAVLERTEAKLRIEVPGLEDYEKDLDTLDRLAEGHIMFSPDGFHVEACAVFGGSPRLIRLLTGEYDDRGYRWDSVSILNASAIFNSTITDLDTMSGRWTETVVPTIFDAEVYPDRIGKNGEKVPGAKDFIDDLAATAHAGEIVEDADTGAKLAGKIAHRQAQDNAKAKETLRQYAEV